MKAIIPVAGHGTRLEPHTLTLQKCLLPVAGKPVIEHILDRITDAGVRDITLIIGYLAHQVKEFCLSYKNANFTFVEQRKRLGLGHAIYQGLDHSDEPVLIVLGDAILELDDDEQNLVDLFYNKGYKQNEISKILNFSKSKVCRMHMKILSKLKKKFNLSHLRE